MQDDIKPALTEQDIDDIILMGHRRNAAGGRHYRVSPVLRQMGMSLEQSRDAIDAFAGLLVVNATSADRAQAAQGALSVALQKGRLDAYGWITIYSSLGSLVDVLAQHSGKSAEEIRKLGASGQLSVNMIAQALAGSYDEIMRQVEGMPTTVRNAFSEYIGTLWHVGRQSVAAPSASDREG
ncbi:tape measure protein [Orrella sp. JC864]|uniref:tape measure protein n=1 Tax=Orrella sp. JC864 TaxID=3120298 RepID=UPI0030092BFF